MVAWNSAARLRGMEQDIPEVRLHFSVSEATGRNLSELSAGDVRIFEDQALAQMMAAPTEPIRQFSHLLQARTYQQVPQLDVRQD